MMNTHNTDFCSSISQLPLFLRRFISLLLTVILFFGLAKSSVAQSDMYPVNITGIVVEIPENESRIGTWLIVDDEDDIEYSVAVTDETSIPQDSFLAPDLDDEVVVWGFRNDGVIDAISVFLLDPEIPDFDDESWNNSPENPEEPEEPEDPEDGEDGEDGAPSNGVPNTEFDLNIDIDIDFDAYWKLVSGIVFMTPESDDGEGQWLIVTDAGIEVEVMVDQYTDFDESIPTIGDRVIVDGFITLEGVYIADELTLLLDNSDSYFFDGQVKELIGVVLTTTASLSAEGTEEWIVKTIDDTYTVLVSTDTLFESRRPSANERVSIWGHVTDSGFFAQEVTMDQFGLGEIIVRLETDTISQTIASRYNLFAESTVLSSGNIYKFASFNPRSQHVRKVLNNMKSDPEIIWAERNVVGGLPVKDEQYRSWAWGTEDAESENRTAYQQINLDLAHTQYLGDGATVAVMDTGVDSTHPELQSRLVQGWDMVDDDNLPNDDGPGAGWGHGTHVSGIVAQVAPNSKIMPIRVLDSNGRGDTFLLAYGIEWAVDHGADVINLSLGVEQYTWVLYNAIQYATDNGVVIVAAAGNANTNKVQYPAAFAEVVGVSAVNSNNEKADFSNYGNWVSISAPGVGIRSTVVDKDSSDGIEHIYANWSGTSMAAPFVAGAAALLHQKLPTASSNAVSTMLRQSATQHEADSTEIVGQSAQLFGGLLNVAAALGIVNPAVAVPTVIPTVVPTVVPTVAAPIATATAVPTTIPAVAVPMATTTAVSTVAAPMATTTAVPTAAAPIATTNVVPAVATPIATTTAVPTVIVTRVAPPAVPTAVPVQNESATNTKTITYYLPAVIQ